MDILDDMGVSKLSAKVYFIFLKWTTTLKPGAKRAKDCSLRWTADTSWPPLNSPPKPHWWQHQCNPSGSSLPTQAVFCVIGINEMKWLRAHHQSSSTFHTLIRHQYKAESSHRDGIGLILQTTTIVIRSLFGTDGRCDRTKALTVAARSFAIEYFAINACYNYLISRFITDDQMRA